MKRIPNNIWLDSFWNIFVKNTCTFASERRRMTVLVEVHSSTEPWAGGLRTWGLKMAVWCWCAELAFESCASLASPEKVVSNLDSPLLSHFHAYYPLCAFGSWPGFMLWGGGLLPSDPFSFQLPPASPRVWCRAGYRVKQTMGFGRSIYFKHDASITVLFATATYLIVLIIGSEVFEIMILKLKY